MAGCALMSAASWFNSLPFALLMGSLLVLVLPPRGAQMSRYCLYVATSMLVLSVASAIGCGLADIIVVIPLSILFGVAWCAAINANPLIRNCARLITLALAFALATHKLPGFRGQIWLESIQFSENTRPFTLIANLDKPWVGAILLLAFSPLTRSTFSFGKSLLFSAMGAITLIVTGMIIGVPLDPKWQPAIVIFLLHNLFLTCIAEEAFFRLLIQAPLFDAVKRWRWGAALSIGVVSLLFGAVHFRPGVPWDVLVVVTLGGCVYALVFHVTRSVCWAIVTHFLTNALHILLLRYPLL